MGKEPQFAVSDCLVLLLQAVAIVSLEDQERLIFEKSLDCLSLIQKEQGSQGTIQSISSVNEQPP